MTTKKKLHVLITSYGYPTTTKKGNPFVEDQALALAKEGVKVGVFLFKFISILQFVKKTLTLDKINDYPKSEFFKVFISLYINFFPFFNHYKEIIFLQKKVILFTAFIRLKLYIAFNGKPDIIHQHYILNSHAFIVEHLSNKFQIPYIFTEHSPIRSLEKAERKIKPYYTVNEITGFVKNAKARIAVSNKFAEIYSHLFECDFSVIPNFVPDKFKKEKMTLFYPEKKKFVFLSIGNLVKVKAQDRLIRAFSISFKGQKDVFLNIAGAGDKRQDLQELIRNENLQEQVQLLGLLDRDGIISVIDESNALVVSSDSETFNISIVEGMFRGLPAVSTRCGGPEEIINENNGLLCEKNEKDLSDKMWEMFNNHKNYNSETIKKGAFSKYSEEVFTEKLIGVYRNVINKSGSHN